MSLARDQHQHPLLDAVASVARELDKAATFNPTFVPTTDKAAALRELSVLVTRTQGLLMGVLATSQSEMIATLPLELPKSITCRGFPACAVTQSLTGRVATTG